MRTLAIMGGVVLATTGSLYAASFSDIPPGANYQIKASEIGSWDSNPLKLAHGAKSLWGSSTTPELIIENKNATSQFSLDSSVVENLYDQSAFNSTDFHEKLNAKKMNERWEAGVNGQLDYDTTRTSELTTFGLNLPNVRRFGVAASPEVSFHSSPVDTLAINGLASHYSYSNAAFIDYEVYAVNPSYAHNFSPNDSAILTFNMQRYESLQSQSNTVDTYGPTLGWQSIINPRLTTNLTAGVEKNSQSSSAATSKSTNLNYVFKGSLAYKGEQDIANITISRLQQPFGNGTETLLNIFSVDESHAINQKLSVNAAATYEDAQYNSVIGINLNHQLIATAGLTYRVFEELDMTGNYQYTSESLTNVSSTITDNAVLFGLVYHPKALAL